jgi:hypothetical protein
MKIMSDMKVGNTYHVFPTSIMPYIYKACKTPQEAQDLWLIQSI